MAINSDQVTGFVVGLGAATLGLYLYKQNQQQVDQWLREQGINVPQSTVKDEKSMSLHDLTREKERLEDLIAEREMQAKEQAAVQPAAEA
jgi:hypothetical protein